MFMHANPATESKHPFDAQRLFPWRCRHCSKSQVVMTTMTYDAEVRHDGRVCTFTVPRLDIPVSEACGEKVFTSCRVSCQVVSGRENKSRQILKSWRAL